VKPPPNSTILRGTGSKQSVSQPSVSIDQLLASLQRRGVPMPFEIGTFLVLEATERLIATMPVMVAASDVWLSDDGELLVAAQGSAATEREACRALIILLGDLLVRSAPGVPSMLLQLVERGPSEGDWRLARVRDDLEASLVPLNRGATRRVLARLLREAKRDVERSMAPPPDENAVDRELDEMLGIESAPAPQRSAQATAAAPRISRPRAPAPPEPMIDPEPEPLPRAQDETIDVEIDPETGRGVVRGRAAGDSARARAANERAKPRSHATEPRPLAEADEEPARAPRRPRRESLDDFEHAAAGQAGSSARIAQWLLVLALALVAAYVIIGRERVRTVFGVTEPAAQPLPIAPSAAPVAAAPRYGELRVTSTPPKAQVLMRVGEGPIVVPKLPLGVAHEFVAMLPGMSPSRAVVPPDAKWAQEGGEARYELALQLGAASAHARENDLGPTRLTQEVGHPSGTLGSVRVITSPPGASVYQLIGFTPDVSVQNLPLDQPVDLLVYLPGHLLQRVRVGSQDWQKTASGMLAEPAVTLIPEKR
jgi:hypothetical protein